MLKSSIEFLTSLTSCFVKMMQSCKAAVNVIVNDSIGRNRSLSGGLTEGQVPAGLREQKYFSSPQQLRTLEAAIWTNTKIRLGNPARCCLPQEWLDQS